MMMDNVKETVIEILKDLTGEDFSENLDENLYDSALLDSMGTVQLLLELQDQLGIEAPVSEFDRNEWDTPAKIIEKVEAMKQ
ncbi:D-alanine--poly(phosphoribitol) ligase subunit DltC [Lentilactobacillus fungorum]|nr:D-alanine--poly(phosphoribitol) ligase subunit DltC [Lentilactobacillus fungorum]